MTMASAPCITRLGLPENIGRLGVTARFNGWRVVALCNNARAQCDDQQMREVMHAHHCALDGPDPDVQAFAVSQFLEGL